ncbi:TonB-dependent receptor [Pontibacter sp. G13]|uniref:SusC/RagA family TonB-linked outer membrane protein n=1 Tax=Pontibacter sp. G13 TaxID=3074898 RepID=UPI00288ADFDD|nr:TonB-dependent receptor [Pontibacter sp. G13]WNJ18678.1 TonB-dependent receptor [Pontibacter sp. G13]
MSTKLTNLFNIPIWIGIAIAGFVTVPHHGWGAVVESVNTEDYLLRTVSGTVTSSEEGTPLVGVTVLIKETTTGVITDGEGRFSIEAETGDVLVFSYLGYAKQEVTVTEASTLNIRMEQDVTSLEEVVVIGYGQQKKSHLTGSVSKVSNEQLDQIPVSRADDALVGQVAGVNIQMTNPAAGEAPVIRVRGQGSISFDSNPLIVIDGIAVGNDADFLSSLDMNDVASIEVLKDAASSAIYGSRGANGIIMITTKQGSEGKLTLSYNGYVGHKSVPGTDVLMDLDEWRNFVLANNDGQPTNEMLLIDQLGTYTDWEKVMFDGGYIQSHNVSANGGNQKTKFRASLSYLDDQGVLLTDNFKKINLRLNLDSKINDRVSFGTMLNPSHTEQRRFPIGVHDALRQHAWLPLELDESNIQFVNPYRENGRWENASIGDYAMERMFDDFDLATGMPSEGSGQDISGTSNQSAYAKVMERDRRKYETKFYGNSYLKFKLAKGLNFRQNIGGDFRYRRNTDWTGVQATRNGAGDSESSLSTYSQFHSVLESILTYKKNTGKHNINAVGGFTYEFWNRQWSNVVGVGYNFDYIRTIAQANLSEGSTASAQEALISYLSRVNYVYDDRYLLNVSVRWDGSSKFGPDNKFGFFPAASAGWNVSNEAFLEDNPVISNLKVRASYGITGSNAGIGEYDHIGLLDPVGTALGTGTTGFNPLNIGNSELRWEKLTEMNAGVDLALFDGRIASSFDYYIRTSQDLLLNLPVPGVTGFSSALVNKGEVENRGFEFEVRTRNIVKDDFSWSTTALLTRNKNTLVDFAGSSGLISIVDEKRAAEWIALEGYPISTYYGYVVDKEIPLEYINNPYYPINAQSQDIYVKDLNGDGLIDTDDRTVLGSPYPDFVWSVNNTLKFKNFDLSFMFQGSQGAEVRNISSQYIKNEFSSKQDYISEFPDKEFVQQRIFTSDDIQDASYTALRNINLGYTVPSGLIPGVSSLRIYVGAQNLLYIMSEGYEGYNPEGIDQGLGNPLTYGYQRGPAPIYRTISGGLNLSF